MNEQVRELSEFEAFLVQMEAGADLVHQIVTTASMNNEQQYPAWEQECNDLLVIAERLRSSGDETIAMFGFRLQMLVHELLEAKQLQQDVDHIHIREIKKQSELLHIAIARTASAQVNVNVQLDQFAM